MNHDVDGNNTPHICRPHQICDVCMHAAGSGSALTKGISEMSVFGAIIPPVLTTVYALRSSALDLSGILASWLVGVPTGYASHRMMLHLYLFFFSSSRITRVGENIKKVLEGKEFKKGGGRNYIQVFSNGGWQTIIACVYIYICRYWGSNRKGDNSITRDAKERQMVIDSRNPFNSLATKLQCMSLSAYACACGDTWASELGILSTSKPILITQPWRFVAKGTNGGISLIGTLASAGGGASIGLGHAIYDLLFIQKRKRTISRLNIFLSTVIFGGTMGLAGSMIDSALGALFQYSGSVEVLLNNGKTVVRRIVTNPNYPNNRHITGIDVLSNHQVNLLSIVLTSFLGYYVAPFFFGVQRKVDAEEDKVAGEVL